MIVADSFTLRRPTTLKEALAMLRDEPDLQPLAGGTDVFVYVNARLYKETRYIDLRPLWKLRYIERGKRDLRFGALTTFTDCMQSRDVQKALPILAQAASEVGGVQIQNRGTLGGNIGNGSPAGDSLPVLMAADALVVLSSADGEREVPLTELYTGYRQSVRKPSELITEIRVPLDGVRGEKQYFRKVGTRAAQAISKIVVAAVGDKLSFGSVGPTVVRARAVEAYLATGKRELDEAKRALDRDISPIDDVRSTGAYRRTVAHNLLAEVLRS